MAKKRKILIVLLILIVISGYFILDKFSVNELIYGRRLMYDADMKNLTFILKGINPYSNSLLVSTKELYPNGGYSIKGNIDLKGDEINIKLKGILNFQGMATQAFAPASLKKNNLKICDGKLYKINIESKDWSDSYEMRVEISEEGCLYNTTFYNKTSTHTKAIGGETNKCSLFFYCAPPTSMENCKTLLNILQNNRMKVVNDLSNKGYGEGKYDLQIKSSYQASKIITDFVCGNKNKNLKIHLMNEIIKSLNGTVYRDKYLKSYEDVSMAEKINC